MIDFDEAMRRVAAAATPLGTEQVALAEAHRRVLATPVTARIASPRTDVSTMDGYAVRDRDLAALPARLEVAGESFPGAAHPMPLKPGQCIRIFTGAPVPPEADRIVIQEVVRQEQGFALFDTALGEARHLRKESSDFCPGDTLLPDRIRLEPRHLVAAAAADVGTLTVFRQPRVVLLATGDELAEPGTAASGTGIPDSVSIAVAALGEACGGRIVGRHRIGDRLEEMERAAGEALERADLIVVTGGASVGEKDFAKAMFERHGLDLIFSKVSIKPGKPVWFGRAGGRLVLGLPGNPTSALVTARLFLVPLLAGLTGRYPALGWRKARLAHPVGPTGDRETFARATSEGSEVRIAKNQDSGAQGVLAECDLLVRLPAGSPGAEAGAVVDALDL